MKRWYVNETPFGELFIAPTTEPKYKMERIGFTLYNTYAQAQAAALVKLRCRLQKIENNIKYVKRGQVKDW